MIPWGTFFNNSKLRCRRKRIKYSPCFLYFVSFKMKNINTRDISKFVPMLESKGPTYGNLILFRKVIFYCQLHIRKCLLIFGYPPLEVLQASNLVEHTMISYIVSNKPLCLLNLPFIKYFLNKSPGN